MRLFQKARQSNLVGDNVEVLGEALIKRGVLTVIVSA